MHKKVLLIEDERIDALRISRAVSENFSDVSVEVLTTGEQALDWLHRFRGEDGFLSLIVMDLGIPRMHGLELLSEFKRNELVRDVPIVIFSGTDDAEAIRLAYRAGASAYVIKPVAAAEMKAALSNTLVFWLKVNQVSAPSPVREHKSIA